MRSNRIRGRAICTLALLVMVACAEHATVPTSPDVAAAAVIVADAPAIVITELMPNPAAVSDDIGEWFELFNAGDTPVNLNGWQISSFSSETHTIGTDLIVPAHGFAVLGRTADMAVNGGAPVDYAYGTAITLNNSTTDWLTLKMSDGTLVDSVAYSTRDAAGAVVSPTYTPGNGIAHAVLDATAENTVVAAGNWAPTPAGQTYGAGDRGSPGSGPYTDIGPVTSVTVTPDPAVVGIGGAIAFTAVARDADDQIVFTTFTWSTMDAAVASVSDAGVATGIALGTVAVTATAANDVAGSAMLEVTPAVTTPQVIITEVMSNPTAVGDVAGEWFEVFNASADPIDLEGWRIASGTTESHIIGSSVVVPACGLVVLANNVDSAMNGGVNAAYAYSSITLNNSNTDWLALRLPDGATVDSVAYSARNPDGTIGSPAFSPTAGASVTLLDATIDNTVIAAGNWLVTPSGVTYGAGDRGTPGTGPYCSGAGPVASVTLSPSPAGVAVGGTIQFTALARDADGNVVSSPFEWVSDDVGIATVDAAGLATGVATGTATITATAPNSVSGSAPLNVVLPGEPASVTVAINVPAEAPVGYVKPAFPTVRDVSGSIISPPPPLTWSSSNPAVAAVDDRGYISALGAGTTSIRATADNGVFGTRSFTVIPATAPTSAVYRNHVEFGVPGDGDAADDMLMDKAQFVLSYNPVRGGPNWVSWNLNATQFGPAPRCDCFSPDLELPTSLRIEDFDYRNGGYDRGHMVQSESRTTTPQENAATFLLTNILPQAANNNQGPWLNFENFLNDQARLSGREVYVIAGGEYAVNAPTIKDEGKVAIPDYTWKVAVVLEAGEGLGDVSSVADLQVLAVRMPNRVGPVGPASADDTRNLPWQTFQTTVYAIEQATGYNLLADLPDDIEAIVEEWPATNAPPVISSLTQSPDAAVQIRLSASVAIEWSDLDSGTHEVFVDWGDGSTSNTVAGNGSATLPHVWTQAGIYTVAITVTDELGAEDEKSVTFVVYDPDAGNVNAGGWFEPGPGEDRALVNVQARFSAGGQPDARAKVRVYGLLDFEGDAAQWLVVQSGVAVLSIAGALEDGTHALATITLTDGAVVGGADRLRVRITRAGNGELIYDNDPTAPAGAPSGTVLGGGQVRVR